MSKKKIYANVAKFLIAALLIPIFIMMDASSITAEAAPDNNRYLYALLSENEDDNIVDMGFLNIRWYSGNGTPRIFKGYEYVPALTCLENYFGNNTDLMIVVWDMENTNSNVYNPGLNNTHCIMCVDNVFGITSIEEYNINGVAYPAGGFSALSVSESCNSDTITVEFSPLVQDGACFSYYKVKRTGNQEQENNTASGNNTSSGNNTASGNNTRPGENLKPGNNNTIHDGLYKGILPVAALDRVRENPDLILFYLLEYKGQKYLLLITSENVNNDEYLVYRNAEWLAKKYGKAVTTSVKAGKYYVGKSSEAQEILKKFGITSAPGKKPSPGIGKR